MGSDVWHDILYDANATGLLIACGLLTDLDNHKMTQRCVGAAGCSGKSAADLVCATPFTQLLRLLVAQAGVKGKRQIALDLQDRGDYRCKHYRSD